MKVHQFLDNYGITENPFAQEDAQSDHVFRAHCLDGTHHPAWDKIYGNPAAPSTSVVFGEQGSGKTALRMQMIEKLRQYNREHPQERAFIIEYDDFNPFLDCFRERLTGRRRRPEHALQNWKLWDHMDAILTLGTTRLASLIRGDATGTETHNITDQQLEKLTRLQKRDILLLAAFYDHNRDQSPRLRWQGLRRRMRFASWPTWWDVLLGIAVTAGTIGLVLWKWVFHDLFSWPPILAILAGWLPWLFHQARLYWLSWRAGHQIRVIDHHTNSLRRNLGSLQRAELVGQPMPSQSRGDDRYELLTKLQAVLKTLGFSSIVVLVDRVDEPHLINGNAERMRDLLWPMFDNKFLKHPAMAFKLLLPAAVVHYLNRQEKEFYDRSRLDKQNLIPALDWSGEALYDVANDRIRACAELAESPPSVQDLFESAVSQDQLVGIFSRLRAPGICSSSSTGCSSTIAASTRKTSRAGRSAARHCRPPWRCFSRISKLTIRGAGQAEPPGLCSSRTIGRPGSRTLQEWTPAKGAECAPTNDVTA